MDDIDALLSDADGELGVKSSAVQPPAQDSHVRLQLQLIFFIVIATTLPVNCTSLPREERKNSVQPLHWGGWRCRVGGLRVSHSLFGSAYFFKTLKLKRHVEAFDDRACSALRCRRCDLLVARIENAEWHPSADYMFLRAFLNPLHPSVLPSSHMPREKTACEPDVCVRHRCGVGFCMGLLV